MKKRSSNDRRAASTFVIAAPLDNPAPLTYGRRHLRQLGRATRSTTVAVTNVQPAHFVVIVAEVSSVLTDV